MKNRSVKLLLLGMLLVMQACGDEPAIEAPPPTQIVVIEPPSIPTPTEIVHTTMPNNLPSANSGIAADQDSARTSADHTAPGGDRFTYGEYERPFNAIAMDRYFTYLDIQQYEILQDNLWIYAIILLRSRSAEDTLPGQYALEIDNDIDGKGDFLILVSAPASTDWSTANVQIWEDRNNDVGGVEPVKKDNLDPGFIDGFEIKVFENGVGINADAAWGRISPDNPNAVQIAVQRLLVDDDGKYLAGTWAGTKLDPAMFDFNDSMSKEEAGDAVKTFAYYPIQFLAEMDNACRIPIGILVSSDDLGLCQVFEPTPSGGQEKEPGEPPNSCQPIQCPPGLKFDETTCQCHQ